MARRTLLFICTGNCCRSQMAEAIARQVASDDFDVFSCGADPAGFVHPVALRALELMGISAVGLESKGWEQFLHRNIDIAITVCDSAHSVCPSFPGGGYKAHWPLVDPSFLPGSDDERIAYACRLAERLKLKIERLAAIDLDNLGREAIEQELDALADL